MLRPGGDLVISDLHHEWGAMNPAGIKARGPAGEPCLGVEYRHKLGDYLRPDEPLPEPATEIGDWQDWPWSLMSYLPFATRVASRCPTLVIWHFQLPAA